MMVYIQIINIQGYKIIKDNILGKLAQTLQKIFSHQASGGV